MVEIKYLLVSAFFAPVLVRLARALLRNDAVCNCPVNVCRRLQQMPRVADCVVIRVLHKSTD